eukprot:GILJ01003012.1.p1 GENE.GILJ01003012.1~~GILJ01003012.1.p1  ORF type:complete len:165 (+),score=19.78 GILJ01003012.1:150-644(+)
MDDSPVSSFSRDDVLSQVRASLVSNGSITAVYAAPSRIHGQGLHAKKDFRTGEFICEYYGVLTSRQDSSDGFAVNAFLKVDCNLSKYKPQDLYCLLDPKTDKTAGLFLNHSCAANAVVLPLNLQSHLGFTDAEAQYLRYPIARSAFNVAPPSSFLLAVDDSLFI